jgi:hypothetical protein
MSGVDEVLLKARAAELIREKKFPQFTKRVVCAIAGSAFTLGIAIGMAMPWQIRIVEIESADAAQSTSDEARPPESRPSKNYKKL